MMNNWGLCCLIAYFATISTTVSFKTTGRDSNPLVDALIEKLNEAEWGEDEAMCRKTTVEMLYGVKNKTLWAVWAWDAMQPPVGALYATSFHLGNYDQCLKPPWSQGPVMQYCLVDVNTGRSQPYRELGPYDSVEDYLQSTTKHGRPFDKQTFGTCLPSTCKPDAAAKIYRLMHQFSYLTEGEVTVNPRDCQVAGEAEPVTMGFIVFWCLIAALTLMVIFCTYYNNKIVNKNTILETITRQFCLISNMENLVQHSESDIKVMNGIRVLSAVIVVNIHETFVQASVPNCNSMDMDRFGNSTLGKIIFRSDIVVDTFVTMSGLLLAKSLLSGNKNMLISLVKRYLRLIGPLVITTLFLMFVIPHTGDGPFWKRGLMFDVDTCQAYWWKNFLMINNDIRTVCNSASWYVYCDYQLAVLGTFIFYIYRRNQKVGLSVFFGTGVLCTAKIGWLTYSKRLPLLPFENVLKFVDYRNHTFLNDVYFNVESRAASYFIGMAMGYLFTVYKPTNYRNSINRTWSTIILASSLLLMNAVFSLKYLYDPATYNAIEVAFLVAFNRSVWVLGICGIILVSEYGCKNIITRFLSAPVFGPLSKLTYGVHLIHLMMELRNIVSARSLVKFDMMLMVTGGLGVAILSCIVSFIMYLLVEAPLLRISDHFFNDKNVGSKKNVIKHESCHFTHECQNGNSKSKLS